MPADRSTRRRAARGVVIAAAACAVVIAGCTAPPPSGTPATGPPVSDGGWAPSTARGGDCAGPGTGRAVDVPADAVRLDPDDDWQAVIDAEPAGTTFVLACGVHRGFSVVARDGDAFVGEVGAVLHGAVPVTGFTRRDDGVWEADGTGKEPELTGTLDEGWEREGFRHDLYLDGDFMRHVPRPSELRPGTWFYDFEADRILIGEDPTGHLVEQSQLRAAISGPGTSDVTIRDIEIGYYATPAQHGAVDGSDTVGWLVERVEVHHNHGAGIRFGDEMVVRGSIIRDNGQIGLAGGVEGTAVEVVGNAVLDNGRLGFRWFWEKGGMKLVGSVDAVVRSNRVAGNTGPGIWFDLGNEGGEIRDNEVHGNSAIGIFYELSGGGVIEDNVVTGNGWAETDQLAAGISLANSGRVVVRDNELAENGSEISITWTEREEGGVPPVGIHVTGNDVTATAGTIGFADLTGDGTSSDPAEVRFDGNAYRLAGCEPCFRWGDPVTAEEWRAIGHDAASTFEEVER